MVEAAEGVVVSGGDVDADDATGVVELEELDGCWLVDWSAGVVVVDVVDGKATVGVSTTCSRKGQGM